MQEELDKTERNGGEEQISRKEALWKAGKYAAFTAGAMMFILDPVNGQPPKSPPKPPGAANRQKKATKPKKDTPPPSF